MANQEIKFLLWNTYKQPLFDEIKQLVTEHEVNFLIVIENPGDSSVHLNFLKTIDPNFKRINQTIFQKAQIFTSIPNIDIREVHGHGRYGLYHLTSDTFNDILICLVHFPSKVNWGDSSDHFGLCVEMKRDIELKELELGHSRTIVLGDFNMNPFEIGMLNASGLNNTSSKEIAFTESRDVLSRNYKYFYNPMWSFMGDYSKGKVQGTYYFNSYKYNNFHWNIYDQVMLRPDILKYFDDNNLEIIDNIYGKSLIKTINNITRVNKEISDHLPIKFNLTLTNK